MLFLSATVGCGGGDGRHEVLAGVGRADLTPTFEPYQDLDGDRRRGPGEPFEDLDGDSEHDSLWLGGFGPRQPTGVHDPLEARSLALALDGTLYCLTAVDALGLSLGRVRSIQQAVLERADPALGLERDRILVAATHTHSGPDTIGVFGPGSLEPGWDGAYLDRVVEAAVESILAAISALEPAELVVAEAEAGAGYVRDLDPPEILDPTVGILHLRRPAGAGLASLVSIANHPETIWSDNLLVSADYPGVLRERLEAELGGLAIYFSGALGLMQSPAEVAEAGFARAEKLGEMYAELVVGAVAGAEPLAGRDLEARFGYADIRVGLENFALYVAITEGVAEGYLDYLLDDPSRDCELACFDLPAVVLQLGRAWSLVSIPGELTPELVVGGVRSPPGYAGPYPDAPVEPHLEAMLATKLRFVVGLALAEVGYLYPKRTYWPDESYSQQHGPGPGVAMQFMTGLGELVARVASGTD